MERLFTAGAKAEVTDTGGMNALALACVKLCNILVLSGAKASAAEKSAKISLGCWVRVRKILPANDKEEEDEGEEPMMDKESEVPEDSLCDVVMTDEGKHCINIDFEETGCKSVFSKKIGHDLSAFYRTLVFE